MARARAVESYSPLRRVMVGPVSLEPTRNRPAITLSAPVYSPFYPLGTAFTTYETVAAQNKIAAALAVDISLAELFAPLQKNLSLTFAHLYGDEGKGHGAKMYIADIAGRLALHSGLSSGVNGFKYVWDYEGDEGLVVLNVGISRLKASGCWNSWVAVEREFASRSTSRCGITLAADPSSCPFVHHALL